MKSLKKICCALFLTVACFEMHAQATKDAKTQTPEEKAMMAYMTPGKMHDMLAKSIGVWTEDATMWMAADAPPMKFTLTCVNRMIMGNRYLQGMNRGTVNNMPFEGISTVAYDNAKKVFINTWIDNMGTGIMYSEGTWNESNKSIEFNGSQVDPMSGKELKARQVMKFIDDNNQLLEMYMTPLNGKEYKSMEIKYTKKAGMPAQPGRPGQMPGGMTPPTPAPKEPVKPNEKK